MRSGGAPVWLRSSPPTLPLRTSDLRLEADLHHALERNEFEVWYQPIISLNHDQMAGVEALVRWRHPERGMVSPGQFIPLAEKTGYILPLGRWVLQSAVEQLQQWSRVFPKAQSLFLNVNLSPRQFLSRNIVSDVVRILKETGFPPENLSLEITESALVPDEEGMVETLQRLKELGIRLAVDDFGTGYSSLSYIRRLPVDQLKIDRTFVDGLGKIPENTAIVRAVITFARTLKMSVTGEGIETMEQLRELKLLGCDRGQGYLFSRPVTADEIQHLIANL